MFASGTLVAVQAAEVPIPRPKPKLSSGPAANRPIEAIDRLVGADPAANPTAPADAFNSPVTGYAPPASFVSRSRFPTNIETQLRLTAKLAQDGDMVADGVQWRIFGELPDREGKLPMIASASGGDAEFTLRPGRYLVHAGFGRAGQAQLVEVDAEPKDQTFVLDAGGIRLDATLGSGAELQPALLKFEIYRRDPDGQSTGRELITTAEPGKIVPLAAGAYHIVSSYGGVNAQRTADLVVEPGKLTTVTMEHGATGVTLKLVSEAGGEAIADTSWAA